MDRLAHHLVAAERERDVGDAAGDVAVGQGPADNLRRLDEVDGIVVVFLHAGGDGEDVGIEDDVLGRETDLLGEDLVGARADLDLAFAGVGLALLVEGHDHGRRAVAQHRPGLLDECGLAFLHRDRVDHALALQALEAGLDHAPLRRVDHHRDAGDVGLRGDQGQEAHHRLLGVDHALVHVDVEDLGTVGDLLARDLDRLVEAILLDQLLELRAAGDVGAFADVDEQQLRSEEHTSELQSLMRISYAVFCLTKKYKQYSTDMTPVNNIKYSKQNS